LYVQTYIPEILVGVDCGKEVTNVPTQQHYLSCSLQQFPK